MESAMYVAATESNNDASSYRVKFDKPNFLELVRIARPKVIYHRKNMHFFAFDGFVMYCDQCENGDFSQIILEAIEFSNAQWSK
ncbi:MAG: hypothetical protein NWE92_03725 [Candidatus Bathyarchaeota archaeon]|nr:hypothetical protein [Candidatus Bathyarchaeota archaeon]